MNRSVDVVIVGYGPVGSTAANFLGQAGLRVTVIEKDPSPYPRARAISTDEEVLRTWQQVGLADELVSEMLGNRPIDFVDRNGKSFLNLKPKSRGNGYLSQYFIYQPALEATIRRGVDRFSNVEVLLECEAGEVRQSQDQVEIDLIQIPTGAKGTITAQYLLACDGGSSGVRTQLGIGFEGKSYEDRWLVIDTKVTEEWPEVDQLRFHCDPERPAVDCPTPLGHHRWEFPVFRGEREEELQTDENIWRLLGRHGITEKNVRLLRKAVYTHHVRFASQWKVGRILFLGDAAHVMPPWIGQGMASGVRDAGNVCWKVAAVINGEADASLLDTYEPERQPDVRSLTKTAVFFGGVITETRRSRAILRNIAFGIAKHTPVLGPYLRNADWMRQSSVGAGLVDKSGSSGKGTGSLVPQPWVATSEEPRCRLDQALGQNWAVITRSAQEDISRHEAWKSVGAGAFTIVDHPPKAESEIQDLDGSLIAWMDARKADTAVLRPDHFVYAAASSGSRIPAPPSILNSTRKEVPA